MYLINRSEWRKNRKIIPYSLHNMSFTLLNHSFTGRKKLLKKNTFNSTALLK